MSAQVEILETRVLLDALDPLQVVKGSPTGAPLGQVAESKESVPLVTVPQSALGSNVTYATAAPLAAGSFPGQSDDFFSGGFLTGPSTDAPVDIAKRFLASEAAKLGLEGADVSSFRVTGVTTSQSSGLTHVYLRQQYNGIDIDGGDANVSIMADGRVVTVGNRLFSHVASRVTSARSLSASEAILAAAQKAGIAAPRVGDLKQSYGGATEERVFSSGNVSQLDVPAKLIYQLGADGRLHLSWNLNVLVPGSSDWFEMNVDASSGTILRKTNWTHYSTFTAGGTTPAAAGLPSGAGSTSVVGQSVSASAGEIPNSGTYNVFALPTDAPNDGARSLQVNPADPVASPYGWHDTNGAPGAEFTDTRGNNVSAQEDRDDTDTGGFRPNGGSNLLFNFPLDLTQDPSSYQAAAITQLFYTNNILHDIHYHYGFDEASGNFQVNNYGRGGLGNDAVQADAQDGSGFNNANFATPPDGFSPRMQQYVFTLTLPNRDSDLDLGIITHEYGHGVSNRLTGGPANANALDAIQSGGMGEGWSDFWALMFTQRPTDTQNEGYGLGTYVLGQSSSEGGIRNYPYSFNMAINPHTYANFNLSPEVHDSGEIWASALWDLNWLLINKHGYSSDLIHGSGGNNLALQLVMDGLKLQPANPSFLDGRDAILAADLALTGGQNASEIWTAFARRGMGYSASDGGSAFSLTVTEAFDLPAGPTGTITLNRPYYRIGEPVEVTLRDSDLAGEASVNVTVTSTSGDSAVMTLLAQGAGVFRGEIPTAPLPSANDGVFQVAGGDTITVTYIDTHTQAGPGATVSVAASIAQDVVLLNADFSDAAGNPSLDGFTIDNTGARDPGLWHLSTGRGNQPGHSADDSMYFGTDEGPDGGGTYDVGDVAGRITSPVLDLTGLVDAVLSFNYFIDRENSDAYDIPRVMISANGGEFKPLPLHFGASTNGFQKVEVSLSEFSNTSIQVRFDFDTMDRHLNDHEGWYLDDIRVASFVTQFGRLAGTVFNDADGSGTQDEGESGIPERTVYIDRNGNGELDLQLESTSIVPSPNVPVAIPDLSIATSTLTVTGLGDILDLNVQLDLNHTYDSDLDIFLISPGGIQIPLSLNNGGSANDFQQTIFDDEASTPISLGFAPFLGSYRPESPLSILDGTPANGVWTLRIVDEVGIDFGILNSWSLQIANSVVEPYRVTDSQGRYSFDFLSPGEYTVRDVLPDGFERTTPPSGFYDVTLALNEVRNKLNFGIRGEESDGQSPVFTSDERVNVPENSYSVLTVSADDPDETYVTFSLAGGADKGKFSITPEGVLTFIAPPDYENPTDATGDNVYVVNIAAEDEDGETSFQTLLVTVTPLNDNSPIFTSTASPNVPENTTSVLTVTAPDADLPAQTVSYSLTGGVDMGKFQLTGEGVLSFLVAPDFENPADDNLDNVYLVEVTAYDGNGATTTQNLSVTVTDVAESDIRVLSATANGQTTLTVTYEIVGSTVPAFDLGVYRSSDNLFGGDALLQTVSIVDASDRTVGIHTKTWTIGGGAGEVPLPGAGAPETQADYFLHFVADPTNAYPEMDADPFNEDNTARFRGVYHQGTGDVMVFGGADSESITVTSSGPNLNLNFAGTIYTNAAASVSGFRIRGAGGDDSLLASNIAKPVSLYGGEGNDTLTGGSQADRLEGGAGDDLQAGGNGDDVYAFDADSPLGSDVLSDSGGIDTLDFSATAAGVTVNLGLTTNQAVVPANLTLSLASATTFENLIGGSGNDTLTGNSLSNRLQGMGGIDALLGGAGNDFYVFDVDFALGSDTLTDTSGVDTLDFSPTDGVGVTVNLGQTTNQTVVTDMLRLTLGSSTTIRNIIGGARGDSLTGNAGTNVLVGGPGDDTLGGGAGNDIYQFDADATLGSDTLVEAAGSGVDLLDFSLTTTLAVVVDLSKDLLQVVNGNLSIRLSAGNQFEDVTGGSLGDTLTGNSLNNSLNGGLGDDTLIGNAGNDSLTGGTGNDAQSGGEGNDTYQFDADSALGSDTLTETPTGGVDTLNFAATTTQAININLASSLAQAINGNLSITLSAGDVFENVNGGSLNDILVGNALANTLLGGPGNDTLTGAGGDDLYPFDADAPQGSDTLIEIADGGVDLLDFSATTTRSIVLNLSQVGPQIVNSNLTLTLSVGDAFDNVTGGALDDSLTGNALANALTGNAGADVLTGADGNDTLNGGAGNDTLDGGNDDDVYAFDADANLGSDTIAEAASPAGGIDLIDFSQTTTIGVTLDLFTTASQIVNANLTLALSSVAAIEMAIGTSRNDTLRGNALNNVLIGGAGSDSLFGLAGRDLLVGGTGADALTGGDEEDLLISGILTYYDEGTKVLNRAAINAIMAEWSRTDPGSNYNSRILNLKAGGGLNGATVLSGLTVLSDGAAIDTLFGQAGLDWFWSFGGDSIGDLNSGGIELIN